MHSESCVGLTWAILFASGMNLIRLAGIFGFSEGGSVRWNGGCSRRIAAYRVSLFVSALL